MAFLLTAEVSFEIVQMIFKEFRLLEKALHGTHRLELIPGSETEARSPSFAGGTSGMFKHIDEAGRHIADSHRIIGPDRQILHWDGKGVLVGEVYVWRRSEPTPS